MNNRVRRFIRWNNGLVFILPSLFGLCLFFLFPYLEVVKQSFTVNNVFSFGNYQLTIKNKAFILAVKNSFAFILVCVPLLLSGSLLIAFFLQKMHKKTKWLKTGFLVPLVIPVASVVFFWRILFAKAGLLNLLLSRLNLSAIDWMNTTAAFWILVLTYVWKYLGYTIILWLAGLATIPDSIYEAAKIDGADSWQLFWRITWPNLLPSAFLITVLSLVNTFKIFREAYLVSGEYPHQSMYMLQHVFNNWFREMEIGKIAAGSLVNIVAMLLFILILNKKWGDPHS